MGCSVSFSQNPLVKYATQTQGRAIVPAECLLPEIIFTKEEKSLLKSSWKTLGKDLTVKGTKVFLKIFQLNPHLKSLFPFRHLEGERLTRSHEFKGHALRFMQAVGAIVDNIDHLYTSVGPLLVGLGRQHVMFRGFKPDFFQAFQDAMMDVWREELGANFDDVSRTAWQKVFQFILAGLQAGYKEGIKSI